MEAMSSTHNAEVAGLRRNPVNYHDNKCVRWTLAGTLTLGSRTSGWLWRLWVSKFWQIKPRRVDQLDRSTGPFGVENPLTHCNAIASPSYHGRCRLCPTQRELESPVVPIDNQLLRKINRVTMRLVLLALLAPLGLCTEQAGPSSTAAMVNGPTPPATTVNNSAVSYSLTMLPAASAAPGCVFNCLNDAGLRGASGCDFDLTNDCACLSAPAGSNDFLTSCVATVCSSSTAAYETTIGSLYNSYCSSIYGSASLASASSAEASMNAAAAASSMSAMGGSSAKASPSPTASAKSDASSPLLLHM
jgi:hypothetical protein